MDEILGVLPMDVRHFIAGAMSLCLAAASAQAGEWRLGVAKHDLTDTEGGADIQGQIVFDAPGPLANVLGGLQPYVSLSSNTDGYINFGGVGLMVQKDLSPKWFAEFQFGIVAHDGRTDLPPPNILDDGTPIADEDLNNPEVLARLQRRIVLDNEKTYGCDALFVSSPAIGRRINQDWAASVYWEHLSHGKILCSGGKNEGLDNLGVRISRRF